MNNAIQITAGLTCTALTSPAIGMGPSSLSLAYTAGDRALDYYVNVTTLDSSPTNPDDLNTALGGAGWICIDNPATIAGVANTKSVTLYCGAATTPPVMGVLPPGARVVMPITSTLIYGATVSSGSVMVGVSIMISTANA